MKNMERNSTISFIQIVCAISVVTLHANTVFWQFSPTERYWRTANVVECVFYFAVPVFFMISGITLLDYRERYSTGEFFKRRFVKTVMPYIFWSIIGLAYMIITDQVDIYSLDVMYIVNGLLNGNLLVIYWFFPALFCLYLSFPLFAAVPKEKKKSIFEYLFFTGLFVNTILPFVITVLNKFMEINISWPYQIAVMAGYLIWPVGGYLVFYYPPRRNCRFLLYVMAILGLLTHIIGTEVLSLKADNIDQTFKGYNNLPCVLYSLGVFLMLSETGKFIMRNENINKICLALSRYTFAIYLMHWFLLDGLSRSMDIDIRSIIWRLGVPIPIALIVILITMVLRKIPVIRRIVP